MRFPWQKEKPPMGLLSDREIRHLCLPSPLRKGQRPMIENFVPRKQRQYGVSSGLSSFGYDARIGNRFMVCRQWPRIETVDLDNPTSALAYEQIVSDYIILAPGTFILAQSIEQFNIPPDILAICQGKSTMARFGINVFVTPLEPGWDGILTFEISNHGPAPVKLYAGQGIAQLLFFRGEQPQNIYSGKYQNQTGVTPGIRG